MILIGSQKQSTCVGRALLRRRAWARTVGAEHAAISRLRPQQLAASPALVEELARVGRHRLGCRSAAYRTGNRRFERDRHFLGLAEIGISSR